MLSSASRHLADPLLDLLLGGPVAPAVARRGGDQERHRDQRQRREQGVDDEHRGRGEQDRQGALGDPDQPVAEEEADRLQVDRRPRHQLTGLLAVEEAELEPLQVLVEDLAQVVLDVQRDLARDQPPGDGQREAQDAGAEQREHEGQDVVASLVLDRVHRGAEQQRNQTVIPIATQASSSEKISGRP